MLQFGLMTYQKDADYTLSLNFIEYYKNTLSMDKYASKLLDTAIRSRPGIGKSILIFSRLHFWGQLDINSWSIIGDHITPDNFSKIDYFERQELMDCLGHSLLMKFIGTNQNTAALDTSWASEDAFIPGEDTRSLTDEVWAYIPPPTGFFSVIENIVLAKFFCTLHNKRFKLDLAHTWWRYPIPFLDLMGEYGQQQLSTNLPHQYYLTWNVLRESFRNISPSQIHLLKKFKVQEYRKIKQALLFVSDELSLSGRPNPEDCILFKRGGDKIQLETIEGPGHHLQEDVTALVNRGIEVKILSDDYLLGHDTTVKLGLPASANITERSRSGYHLHSDHQMHDVHTIIKNFLILSNAKYSLSCPSSNIVNSAHWSNRIMDSEFRHSSLPSLRYLYL